MQNYIGTKFIQAEPEQRDRVECGDKTLIAPLGAEITDEWLRANGCDPANCIIFRNLDGYHVRYADGYESWSPKDVFEKAYHNLETGMTFSDALVAMKTGCIVRRKLWLSKVVALRKGYTNIEVNEDTCAAFHVRTGTRADVAPYLQVRELDILQVYIPTMEDMMAEDWLVVKEAPNE